MTTTDTAALLEEVIRLRGELAALHAAHTLALKEAFKRGHDAARRKYTGLKP